MKKKPKYLKDNKQKKIIKNDKKIIHIKIINKEHINIQTIKKEQKTIKKYLSRARNNYLNTLKYN